MELEDRVHFKSPDLDRSHTEIANLVSSKNSSEKCYKTIENRNVTTRLVIGKTVLNLKIQIMMNHHRFTTNKSQ